MTTAQALLKAVLAAPEDDLPRLVFADWLEEHGEHERAEFIRLAVEIERQGGFYGACKVAHPNATVGCGSCGACQITRRMDELVEDGDQFDITASWKISEHWAWSYRNYDQAAPCPEAVVRRGFVDEVRCRLADWCGGECRRCRGCGWLTREQGPLTQIGVSYECPDCDGTRRTPGIGPAVVRSHPVTSVILTDVITRSAVPGSTFGRVTRESAGPLWPVAFTDFVGGPVEGDYERIQAVISTAAISWAKSQPAPSADSVLCGDPAAAEPRGVIQYQRPRRRG